jgi:hypothetical protein
VAAASDSPLSAARRSFERFSRCSGISVTGILLPRGRDAHECGLLGVVTVERGAPEK